jgi:hypothetical protein
MEIDHEGNGMAEAKRNLLGDFPEEEGSAEKTGDGNLAIMESTPPPAGTMVDNGRVSETKKETSERRLEQTPLH